MDVDDMLRVSTENIHRVMFHVPQKFIRVSKSKKPEVLLEILEKEMAKKSKIIIFSNKSPTSDFVQMFLNENNIPCVNFNGGNHYKHRSTKLDMFLTGQLDVMSCTDLISRGIDTSSVQ